MEKVMERRYEPQVDEISFSGDLPPPAYPKGYSNRYQLTKLISWTILIFVALIGAFILLGIYINTGYCQCPVQVAERRLDVEPLFAASETQHNKVPLKLHLGDDLQNLMEKKKKRARVDCFLEKEKASETITGLQPDSMESSNILKVTGDKTFISCRSDRGKKDLSDMMMNRRPKRSCNCHCAC